jgi:hypothetical protein
LAPLAPAGGSKGRGGESGAALVRAGSVYGFYYARITDPCYG